MPFYLRKGFRLGPLRFDLSKSGIGVSAGVTGARIGTGPKGSYVHGGRGGPYYRKSLDAEDAPNDEGGPGGRSRVSDESTPRPKDGLARWLRGLFRDR